MKASLAKLGRWFSNYRRRALTLLGLHLVGWLLLGQSVLLPGMPEDDWLALDQWVRAGVFAVVQPQGRVPVSYIDIDDALYRDRWGLPLVTPRDELTKMLIALVDADVALLVVDIDLAWDEADPAFSEFLAGYSGPAPLVFVRRLEETAKGMVAVASPYDSIFSANAQWLRWAHAYFYTDADGTLREWSPWLAYCTGDSVSLLPSAAVIALEHFGHELTSPEVLADCESPSAIETLPIVYTETFGFTGGGGIASTLKAAALLDGARIDTRTLLADRVAVIGGSHAAGQDLRLTPVGILPGAVVQANTILHAAAQIDSGELSAVSERLIVVTLFLVLAVLSFPVAMLLLAMTAVVCASALSYFGIFTHVEIAALLFVQFRILTWLVKPFWMPLREDGWRLFLPEYLRGKD